MKKNLVWKNKRSIPQFSSFTNFKLSIASFKISPIILTAAESACYSEEKHFCVERRKNFGYSAASFIKNISIFYSIVFDDLFVLARSSKTKRQVSNYDKKTLNLP